MFHELKVWPQFYEAVRTGDKKMEIRKNDRNFKVGDDLNLSEWDPTTTCFTGRRCRRRITHILKDSEAQGLLTGFVILSIKKLPDLSL